MNCGTALLFKRVSVFVVLSITILVFSGISYAGVDCSAEDITGIPQIECEALMALYNSTGGEIWGEDRGWNTATPVDTWEGVEVFNGHVSTVCTWSFGLTGTIPAEIGNLANLSSLLLSRNQLSGSIPPEIGKLTKLSRIDFSGNQLSGSIPSELFNLIYVYDLNLSNNQFSGSIPPEIGNMNLYTLSLKGNNFNGPIPAEIGLLTGLGSLDLSSNQLRGSIPTEIFNLSNLLGLNLSDNQLSGSIPIEICNLTSLGGLSLGKNYLSVVGLNAELESFLNSKDPYWKTTMYGFYPPDLYCKKVSGAVFFDALIPVLGNADYYESMWLKRDGQNVAHCSLPAIASASDIFPENYLGRYRWELSGVTTPLTDWSQILEPGKSSTLQLVAFSTDGHKTTSGPFKVMLQTGVQAEISCQDTSGKPLVFPHTGEVETTFVSSVSGGIPPYSYRWIQDNGYIFSSGESGVNTLGTAAKQGSNLITLEITDASGGVHYVQKIAYIDRPWESGNPAESGSGSRLVNCVDVSNRNLNLFSSDLEVPCKGVPFVLSRSYNSSCDPYSVSRKWRFNLDQRLQIPTDKGGRELEIYRSDGRADRYFRGVDGLWYAGRSGMFSKLVDNGHFYLFTKGSYIYVFDDPYEGGQLLAITDRNGNGLAITSVNDLRKTVTDSAGRTYTMDYNSDGLLVKATDFTGRFVEYIYDGSKNLIEFRDVRGNITHYQYNNKNQLTAIIDPRGMVAPQAYNALKVEYDEKHRVQFVTDANGNRTEYRSGLVDGKPGTGVVRPETFGVNNNIVFAIDSSGRITDQVNAQNYGDYRSRQQFNSSAGINGIAEKGLIASFTNPRNFVTNFGYSSDGRGNRVSTTNAKNETTSYSYKTENDYGNIRDYRTNLNVMDKMTTPMGNLYEFWHTEWGEISYAFSPTKACTQMEYDNDGLLIAVTEPYNKRTQFDYNLDGTVSSVKDANGKSATYSYDSLGRVITSIDRRGSETKYTYDADGNVLTLTRAFGTPRAATITNSYDVNGNLISVREARGNTHTYAYTRDNQLKSVSFVVGGITHTRRYEYDALGRLWKITNENGNSNQNDFDAGGRRVADRDPLGNSTTYSYDKNGNVLSVTDAAGHVTSYTYDQLDRVLTKKDHLNNTVSYVYDADGHISSITDPKGQVTRYEYDGDGQLIKVIDPAGKETTASYDPSGNLIAVSGPSPGNKVTYGYDDLNRLTSITDSKWRMWSLVYDDNGNIISSITPENKTTNFQYDELNRVTSVTYSDNSQVLYTYDLNGNRTSMTDSQGTTSYSYDEANRLSSVVDPYGMTVAYNYDGTGNITAIIYPGNKTLAYSYDAVERLETVTNWLNRTTRYTYNQIHQPIQVINGNGTIVKYGYDDANRLVELQNLKGNGEVISSHDYLLDANGNVKQAAVNLPIQPSFKTVTTGMTFDTANRIITAGTSNFTHDAAGRIISEITSKGIRNYSYNDRDLITAITGTDNYSFSYNGDGNRVALEKNGEVTRYILDINASLPSVIAETNGAGEMLSYYTYGNGLLSSIDAVTGEESFYHFDMTGNTLALTDAGQSVTDAYAYTPYGEVTFQGKTRNPFRFNGALGVMDDGNGLNYMRARYYKPDIKRFLSMDVLLGYVGNPQTLNRYAYVLGDPIRGVDPDGMKKKENVLIQILKSIPYTFKQFKKEGSKAAKTIAEDLPEMTKTFKEEGKKTVKYVVEELPKIKETIDVTLDKAIEDMKKSDNAFLNTVGFVVIKTAKGKIAVSNSYTLDKYIDIKNKCVDNLDKDKSSLKSYKDCIDSVTNLANPNLKLGSDENNIDLDLENIGNSSINSGDVSIDKDGVKTKAD